jgi:hypothetical protein
MADSPVHPRQKRRGKRPPKGKEWSSDCDGLVERVMVRYAWLVYRIKNTIRVLQLCGSHVLCSS